MDGKTIIFLAVATLLRAVLSGALELHPDEAYYWLWSRRLDFGYFDHPPLVAYLIRLTTIFSDGEYWVRFSGILGGVGASALAYRLTFEIFESRRAAFWSVVILNVLPLTAAGFVMTPDVPSFFFWALSVWIFWKIARVPEYSGSSEWLALGLVFGLSLLSKYTSVLFAPCALFFLLISSRHRYHLKSPRPYLALLLSAIVFSPVVFWNKTHGWASFAFQWSHGTSGPGKWSNVIAYLGGQAANGGIFLFLVGGAALWETFRGGDWRKRFLGAMSVPVFVFFGWAAFKKTGEINWPAPAFFALSVAAAGWAFGHRGATTSAGVKARELFAKFSVWFSASLVAILYAHAMFGSLPLASFDEKWALMDPLNRFRGWREFTAEVERVAGGSPVIAIDYQSAAELLYYSRMRLDVRAGTNQFPYWRKDNAAASGRCVAFDYYTDVYSGPVNPANYGAITGNRIFEAKYRGRTIRTYTIYECADFRGF
ncbi:MAG: glycosyltransferase family 39 protein [Endomicrobiia bacterium]|nr:glycosyltransferase family 39 protein [Endomicrobiia bacterium]